MPDDNIGTPQRPDLPPLLGYQDRSVTTAEQNERRRRTFRIVRTLCYAAVFGGLDLLLLLVIYFPPRGPVAPGETPAPLYGVLVFFAIACAVCIRSAWRLHARRANDPFR